MSSEPESTVTSQAAVSGSEEPSLLWKLFSNVKFGVSLLIILAIFSIIGTIIPQTTGSVETLQGYIARLGPERTALYDKLGLLDVYHAWWFNLIMVLMCTSIAVASIDRWPRIYKDFSADEPVPPSSRFDSSPFRRSWNVLAAYKRLADLQGAFAKHFGAPQVSHVGEKEIVLYSNRGRWTRVGVYFVHAGILTTVAGALLGNFTGFTNGQMFIREGSMANSLNILKGVSPEGDVLTLRHELPFTIRCDDFDVQFYDDPRTGEPTERPRHFESHLVVIEQGREVMTKHITVNDPLRYGGYTFYQASYDKAEPSVSLMVTDNETGEEFPIMAKINKPFGLAGEANRYVVRGYEENFQSAKTGPLGLAVGMELVNDKEESQQRFLLFQRFPGFDQENRKARHSLVLQSIDGAYFTGLQIANDPGVWVVWTGSFLMVFGMGLAFFISHRKSWLRITSEGASFAGIVHKHRLAYENKVAAFYEDVAALFAAPGSASVQASASEE